MKLPRRNFFQLSSALAASLSASTADASPSPAPPPQRNATRNRKNVVAIQMKCHAWIDEGIEQFGLDTRARQHPGGGGAVLPGVEKCGDSNALGGGPDVCVVKDDDRGFASQLQVDALQVPRR